MIKNISKINAAQESVKFVKNGMIVGLGTGSTAKIAVELLGKKLSKDFQIKGMPTSITTARTEEKKGLHCCILVSVNPFTKESVRQEFKATT